MKAPTILDTPCQEWQGARNKAGYGSIWRNGRSWLVHRWFWTIANGPIPDGLFVLHRCDNPPCFQLDHLFLGTDTDNAHDRQIKGRSSGGRNGGGPAGARSANGRKTHCPKGHPYNEENTHMKAGGGRRCRICQREANRLQRIKNRGGAGYRRRP